VPFSTGPFHRLLLKTPCGVIPSPSVEITVAIPQRRYFFRLAAGRLFADCGLSGVQHPGG
jgi:hypothetical protein